MPSTALTNAARSASRRRGTDSPYPLATVRPESSTGPTGVSPVQVSTGALGSRPQSAVERWSDRAGRREPLRREQERGPQHHVNPAASSEEQWESRAAHVTAKATSAMREDSRDVAARALAPS